MNDLSKEIGILRRNVQLLIDKQIEFKNREAEGFRKNTALEEKIESQKITIRDLEEKTKIKNLAGRIEVGETREVKLKINELVREIDKCIAQLNR